LQNPQSETIINLGHTFAAWATGSKPPWTLEAEAAEAEAAEDEAEAAAAADAPDKLDTHSVSSSLASAVQLRNAKRRLTALGVLGVYLVWCVPVHPKPRARRTLDAGWLTRACSHPQGHLCVVHLHLCASVARAFRAAHINSRNAPTRADGMLCYKLLGDEAQSSFARSWGISYGVGAASEWKARRTRDKRSVRATR
jgi:hypothetical protein